MNQLKPIIIAIVPLLLVILLVNQVQVTLKGTERPIPEHRISHEKLEKRVNQVELAVGLSFETVDTLFEKSSSTPFGKTVVKRRRRPRGPQFERTILKLQGILQGDSPLAVLVDPSGKTHIVKKGEVVHERKVLKISSTGVTLRDKLGSERIAVE